MGCRKARDDVASAKNPDDYYRFVRAVVAHTKGRVRYWQNDSEPNSPIYWAGTKDQFVQELKLFHKAVKDADPSAVVVAGGYDGLFNPPGTHPIPGQEKGLEFFDTVMRDAADARSEERRVGKECRSRWS